MGTEIKEINDMAQLLLEETEKSASNIKYLLNGFRKNLDGESIISTKSDENLFSKVRKDLRSIIITVKETKSNLSRLLFHTKEKSKNENTLFDKADEKIFPHPDLPNMRRNKLAEAINVLKSASDNMNSLTQRYKLPGEEDEIISNN